MRIKINRIAALCFASICSASVAVAADETVRPQLSVEDLQWAEAVPGVEIAPVWGDAANGAYGRFVKFAPGNLTPLHFHSDGYNAVVLQGTMIVPAGGDTTGTEFPAGSYYFVPGDQQHITQCVSDEACIWYEHSEGKFDLTMVE